MHDFVGHGAERHIVQRAHAAAAHDHLVAFFRTRQVDNAIGRIARFAVEAIGDLRVIEHPPRSGGLRTRLQQQILLLQREQARDAQCQRVNKVHLARPQARGAVHQIFDGPIGVHGAVHGEKKFVRSGSGHGGA